MKFLILYQNSSIMAGGNFSQNLLEEIHKCITSGMDDA
jgi:hypothetical protein